MWYRCEVVPVWNRWKVIPVWVPVEASDPTIGEPSLRLGYGHSDAPNGTCRSSLMGVTFRSSARDGGTVGWASVNGSKGSGPNPEAPRVHHRGDLDRARSRHMPRSQTCVIVSRSLGVTGGPETVERRVRGSLS